jgi:transcription elongation factor Elf1
MDGQDKHADLRELAHDSTQTATDIPTPTDTFLENYQNCPLCGTELLFTHVTHFVKGQATEEAHCPSCAIRVRHAEHTLQ